MRLLWCVHLIMAFLKKYFHYYVKHTVKSSMAACKNVLCILVSFMFSWICIHRHILNSIRTLQSNCSPSCFQLYSMKVMKHGLLPFLLCFLFLCENCVSTASSFWMYFFSHSKRWVNLAIFPTLKLVFLSLIRKSMPGVQLSLDIAVSVKPTLRHHSYRLRDFVNSALYFALVSSL